MHRGNQILGRLRFRLIFTLYFAMVVSGELCLARAACQPFPGADQIWSNKQVHWILIGEIHGSNESPAAFADLVCDALAHGKGVTVAVERPRSEQNALEQVLYGNDLNTAEKTLLDQPGWKNGVDVRASKAMLRLLLSLRQFRNVSPNLAIAAIEMPYKAGDSPGERDRAMGGMLLALGNARPKDLILTLTGNVHAMKATMFGYEPAAAYLPAEKELSLEVTDAGSGQAWTEWNGACGPTENGVKEKGHTSPRGVYLDSTRAPYGRVDGILALGISLTPSEPADEDSNRLPACTRKFEDNHSADSGK